MNMKEKQIRSALIERYLNAETTPAEEQRLRDWFARHEPDEDEREAALLVGLDAPCASCLPELDETEKEFDRIVAEGRPAAHRRGRRLGWVLSLAAAAAVALFLLLRPHAAPEKPISPVAIAEGIQQILLLNADDIVSVEAVPSGSKAILTAHMKDGSAFSYILTFNEDEGTTSLLACNNPTD